MNWRSLLLVGVVALAGCSALGGGGSPTVTPAAVPSADADADRTLQPPPGIEDGRLLDRAALADAHERALQTRAYVWTKVVRGNDGTRRYVRAAVSNESSLRYDRRVRENRTGLPDAFRSFSVYADGGVQYIRENISRDVRYWVAPPGSPGETVAGDSASVVERALRSDTRPRVEQVSTDRGPRFRVTAEDGTLTALVTPSGLVERFSATVVVSVDGHSEQIAYRGSVEPLTDSPSAPSWLPEARNRTGFDD